MQYHRHREKGFTLIETIIYVAVVGMAVTSLVLFSISAGKARTKSNVVEEVQSNTRAALDIIERTIRTAESIDTDLSTFSTHPGVLVLHSTDAAKEPTTIALDAALGTLTITEGAGEAQLLMSSAVAVSNLVFTDLTGGGAHDRVRIELTAQYRATSDSPEFNYSQELQTAAAVRK